jgi:hypothetical protein
MPPAEPMLAQDQEPGRAGRAAGARRGLGTAGAMVALRRIQPDDYEVIHDGEIVGRIYRMKADRELWRWTIRLWDPPPGPSGGLSRTLDEAMAAFRAKWDACGTKR